VLKFIWAPGIPATASPAPLRLVGWWEMEEDGEHLFRVELCDGLYFVKGKTVEEYGGDYFGNQLKATTDDEAVVIAWKFVMSLIRKRKNRDEQLLGVFYDAFVGHLNVAVPLTGNAAITSITGKFLPLGALAFAELPSGHAQQIPRAYYREGAASELIGAKPYELLSVFAAEDPEFAQRLHRSIELHATGLSADELSTEDITTQAEFNAALDAEVAKRAAMAEPPCMNCGGSGFEHWECKVCQATPDEEGEVHHGKGCYVLYGDGGGSEYPDLTRCQTCAPPMVEAGAEFEAPKCGKCKGEGFVTIAAGYIGQGKRLTCPVCHGSKLAPPADHQPRPIRTQAERELRDAKAHHFSTLARRSKAAKRAKQDGTHHTQETGGEG
jgi:hypothetical protein